MSDREVKSIALFFFLALLDEERSKNLTVKAIRSVTKSVKADITLDREREIISICYKFWSKYLTEVGAVIGALGAAKNSFLIPDKLKLGPWKKFVQVETKDHVFPIIWCEILKYPEAKVAKAIAISEGTLMTRIAKGMSSLAPFLNEEVADV